MIRVFDFRNASQYSAQEYVYDKREHTLKLWTGHITIELSDVRCDFKESSKAMLHIGVHSLEED